MIYMPIAAVVGMLITLMATFNSQLAIHAGQLMSLLIFHICGLSFITLLILFARTQNNEGKAPPYLYCGGMIGVLVVYLNNLCFINIGISVSVTMIILGQSIASVVVDSTGFLNMEKHRFKKRKLFGLGLMLAGMLAMVDQWHLDYLYIVLALLTGLLVLISVVLTSQLGLRIGPMRATQINYLAGLLTIIGVIGVNGFNLAAPITALPGISPLFLFGGGICGVLIVMGFNTVVPKIPAIYTTILMFLGQISTGLTIDFFIDGTLPLRVLLGCGIVFTGLVINILMDKYEFLPANKPQEPQASPLPR